MNAIEWVKQCHEIENDLQKLVMLLELMEKEGKKREEEGFQDICSGFIPVAKRNMLAEKDALTRAINSINPRKIFYSLCSIQGTYKYFSDENLAWSNLWNGGALYNSILDKIIILLQHEKVGLRENEFKEGLLKYDNLEENR
ncbi:hypothetical protein GCL60_11970 [Silvanigrella paludirubra]|uniref:Uncharacterized protein n=1 Tax=Silvanigrella paludirubra TaxID=2499159 RepID=A0A6N6VQN9_9BACT|nr:hypothetical protein [Silvanigrella paludirubra]KAB8037884.1 hypothetical protein GCL60_11970 [Silvanigrella paludirubra]